MSDFSDDDAAAATSGTGTADAEAESAREAARPTLHRRIALGFMVLILLGVNQTPSVVDAAPRRSLWSGMRDQMENVDRLVAVV